MHKSEKIRFISQNEWYHQRFDAAPFFLALIAEAELKKEKRKMKGGEGRYRLGFFEGSKADWYILQDDLEMTSKLLISEGKKDPKISEKLMDLWQEDEKRFYEKCAKLDGVNLQELTNEELKFLYRELYETYLNRVSSSSLIDGFSLYTDEVLADLIRRFLQKKGLREYFSEYFSILTAPVKHSFLGAEKLELIGIALKIACDDGLRAIFNENDETEIIAALNGKYRETTKALEEHASKYFWIKNNYFREQVLSTEHFIREIKKMLKSGEDLQAEQEKLANMPLRARLEKGKLMEELGLDAEVRLLIKISEDFSAWQDERKKSTFFATHYFGIILNEIGSRLGYAMAEMGFLLPSEVYEVLDGENMHYELEMRTNKCFCFWTNEDKKLEGVVIDEQEFNELREALAKKASDLYEEELRGLSASPGRAVGQAKVVESASEISKVSDGDVLIAVMTRPDYVEGMAKAGAIVTNEGGVTSHAAVVSRELGIPCIVGTKKATSVFEDGDFVEVDADSGVARKLKK